MWGALIGAAIAGGISLYQSYQNSEAAADAKESAEKAAAELKTAYANLETSINSHYAMTDEEKAQGEQDVADYQEALRNSNQEDYVKQYYADNNLDDQWTYDHDTNGDGVSDAYDWLNEHANYLSTKAGQAASQQSFGKGLGGWFASEAFNDAYEKKYNDLYDTALNQYNTDRAQSANEWNTYLQTKQNELTNLLTGQSNDLANAKALADMYTNKQDSYWEDLMNERIAALNAGYAADSAAANTGNYTVDLGDIASMIGAGANIGYKTTASTSSSTGSSAFD